MRSFTGIFMPSKLDMDGCFHCHMWKGV